MFGRKYKLFEIFGFSVSVDTSWIFIALLISWALSSNFFPMRFEGLQTTTYWFMGILGAIGLFASIIAHELAHSLVARRQGTPMSGITLFIFGGVAHMEKDEPKNPGAEFLMAAVGPLASLILAVVFWAIYSAGISAGLSVILYGPAGYLAAINLILAIFNLLPAFPLDGGRILRAVLWRIKNDFRWATRISSQIGSLFGLVLFGLGLAQVLFAGIMSGLWWVLIGLFLYSIARGSYQQLVVKEALAGETVSRFMKKDPITIGPDASLRQVVEDYMYKYHHKLFPVVENNRLLGCITANEIKGTPREKWEGTKVSDVLFSCSPDNTINPKTQAVDALSRMSKTGRSRLMVVEDGQLEGVITLKDLLYFLSLKVEFSDDPKTGSS